MAIIDAENTPSFGQSVVGAAGAVLSTNAIDLLTGVNDKGVGRHAYANARVAETLVGGTSIKAQLIESDNADLSSATVIVEGPVVTIANAVAGAELLNVRIPSTSKQYLGFAYVKVGTQTAGKVSAFITADTDRPNTYPSNSGR